MWRIALLVVLLAGGCKKSRSERQADNVVKREGHPDVINVDEDDPEMERAIAEARRTVDVFVERLQQPRPGQDYFSVKGEFKDGTEREHMWLSDVTFRDGVFHGKVGNDPINVKNVKLGDDVTVAKDEISDWMIIERGELRGGYSIRLLRDRMPADERAALDAEAGMIVNDKIAPD